MLDGAKAYSQTAQATQTPRELEASLLLRAASQMKALQDNWDDLRPTLEEVLNFNRKLWTVLTTSATGDDNPLPQEIKNNVGSLGVYVLNHTLEVQRHPSAEKLTSLININRELAAGLNSQPG